MNWGFNPPPNSPTIPTLDGPIHPQIVKKSTLFRDSGLHLYSEKIQTMAEHAASPYPPTHTLSVLCR